MAIQYDVDICNIALAKIGGDKLSGTSLTEEDKESRILCNLLYEPERDALFESFPWRFAMRRANFDVDDYSYAISAATQANPVVVTSAEHSLSEGDSFYIWDISTGMTEINETIFVAGANSTATALELYKTDRVHTIDGSAYTAYSSGGYVRPCPVSEYSYAFNLPSDNLRVWRIHPDTTDFKEESGFIYTNLEEFEAEYVWKNTTITSWSPMFIYALACKIAAELTGSLQTTKSKEELLAEFRDYLLKAQIADAQTQNKRDHGHRYDPKDDYGWQNAGK